jgi:hypothetical protein
MARSTNPGTQWSPSLTLIVKNWLRSKEASPLGKHLRVGVRSSVITFTCAPKDKYCPPQRNDGIIVGYIGNQSLTKEDEVWVGVRHFDGEGFPIFPDSVVFKAGDPDFFPKLRSQLVLWHNKLIHPASCPPLD